MDRGEHSTVIVVGGGSSTGQAVMYLAQRAKKVLVVIRGEDLNKSMSTYLVRRIEQAANVEVLRHTRVRRCEGVSSLGERGPAIECVHEFLGTYA
jgi:thioredoxin reductase (NADPH)